MNTRTDSDERFKWRLLMLDCVSRLRAARLRFVDEEVMGDFNGSPDKMSIWFICEHFYARERFDLQGATEALKSKMLDAGFPQSSIDTLRTRATSLAEINARGGRFYFFR
jgi:hypothetical protein